MACWMDKLNKSGRAPGVSELSGFANLKNYSWRSLKRRLIRSILYSKDDDSFAGVAEVPAPPVAFAEATRIPHGRSQRLTEEKNPPAIPTLPAAVISRPSPLSVEQTNERNLTGNSPVSLKRFAAVAAANLSRSCSIAKRCVRR